MNNKHLFSKFLLQQWLNAQSEIGIDFFKDNKYIDGFFNVAPQILSLHSVSPGAHVFYSSTGHAVAYVVFWKCGSDGIIRNLNALTTLSGKTSNTHISMNHFVKSQVEFQSVVSAMNWGNKSISNGKQLTNPSNLANLTGYFTSEHSGPKVGIGYSAPSMPPMFTFVRDPLQRFVAGYVVSWHNFCD